MMMQAAFSSSITLADSLVIHISYHDRVRRDFWLCQPFRQEARGLVLSLSAVYCRQELLRSRVLRCFLEYSILSREN
jgi:hypothetical protein